MTFQEGWITRQIDLANQEIEKWDDTKREVMLREPQDGNAEACAAQKALAAREED